MAAKKKKRMLPVIISLAITVFMIVAIIVESNMDYKKA